MGSSENGSLRTDPGHVRRNHRSTPPLPRCSLPSTTGKRSETTKTAHRIPNSGLILALMGRCPIRAKLSRDQESDALQRPASWRFRQSSAHGVGSASCSLPWGWQDRSHERAKGNLPGTPNRHLSPTDSGSLRGENRRSRLRVRRSTRRQSVAPIARFAPAPGRSPATYPGRPASSAA